MLPSSPIAISSMSCRVLSRARKNQGVVLGMASFPLDMPISISISAHFGFVSYPTCGLESGADRGTPLYSVAIRKPMRLIQFLDEAGRPSVGRINEAGTLVSPIVGYSSTYEMARAAMAAGVTLERLLASASTLAE